MFVRVAQLVFVLGFSPEVFVPLGFSSGVFSLGVMGLQPPKLLLLLLLLLFWPPARVCV